MVTVNKCRLNYYVQDLTSSQIPIPPIQRMASSITKSPNPSPLIQEFLWPSCAPHPICR